MARSLESKRLTDLSNRIKHAEHCPTDWPSSQAFDLRDISLDLDDFLATGMYLFAVDLIPGKNVMFTGRANPNRYQQLD